MKKHSYSHTQVEHHKDGSHTLEHVHESDPKKTIRRAMPDLDAVHDSMEENLGEPNAGEAQATAPGAPGGAPAL